jgi:hypothetical protein
MAGDAPNWSPAVAGKTPLSPYVEVAVSGVAQVAGIGVNEPLERSDSVASIRSEIVQSDEADIGAVRLNPPIESSKARDGSGKLESGRGFEMESFTDSNAWVAMRAIESRVRTEAEN